MSRCGWRSAVVLGGAGGYGRNGGNGAGGHGGYSALVASLSTTQVVLGQNDSTLGIGGQGGLDGNPSSIPALGASGDAVIALPLDP